MKTLACAIILPLSGIAAAQRASYTYVDQKPPYQNASSTSTPRGPWLTAQTLPIIGTTFQVDIPKDYLILTTFWYVQLAFGVRSPSVPVRELGGYLFTSAEVLVPSASNGTGFVTKRFPIPNNPALMGMKFYNQVLVLTSCGGCGPYWARLSRGGIGTIGR